MTRTEWAVSPYQDGMGPATTGAEAGRATTPVVLGEERESRGQDVTGRFALCERGHPELIL
jgi:hypothetical protein